MSRPGGQRPSDLAAREAIAEQADVAAAAQQRSLPTRPCPAPQAPHHGPHVWRDAGDTFHCDGDKAAAQQRSVVKRGPAAAHAWVYLGEHAPEEPGGPDCTCSGCFFATEVQRLTERLAAVEALCDRSGGGQSTLTVREVRDTLRGTS